MLEDDLSVSKFCYRWLKAAHAFYGGRSDISGYSLQGDNVRTAIGRREISPPEEHVAFLYRVLGSWGFSPHPQRWTEFQTWFHQAEKSFHPYVDDIAMTKWYKSYEKQKKSDSMWSMWHIWFTDHNKLFCLFSNIKKAKSLFVVNRREPGLHFQKRNVVNRTNDLMVDWSKEYADFVEDVMKLDYNGSAL
jgi:hypothetical protein